MTVLSRTLRFVTPAVMLDELIPAAGRPSTRSAAREPTTLSAACDAGMGFRRPPDVARTVTRVLLPATKQTTKSSSFSSVAGQVWETFPGGTGKLRETPLGVEVEGWDHTSFFGATWAPFSTSTFWSVSAVARPRQHSDVCVADRRFFIVAAASLTDWVAVGVDANDAVVTLDTQKGGQTRRLATVAEPLGREVALVVRVVGSRVVVCRNDGSPILDRACHVPPGLKVGVAVTKARCAIDEWVVIDHEAAALATAAQALRAARVAAARATTAATTPAPSPERVPPPTLPPAALPSQRAFSRRLAQRPDIGLLCNGCRRPFAKIGQPLLLWKRKCAPVSLRFHGDLASRDDDADLARNPCFAAYVEGHSRCDDYAGAWLRARFDDECSDNRRRLRYLARTWRPSAADLARGASIAVHRPDGTKARSQPLSKTAYTDLIRRSTVRGLPSTDAECPICFLQLGRSPDDHTQPLVLRLPCAKQHAFHEACLRPWFLKCSICPTCRTDIFPLLRPATSVADSRPGQRPAAAAVRPATSAAAVRRLRPSRIDARPQCFAPVC